MANRGMRSMDENMALIDINIREIIKVQSIKTYFQPVISLKKMKIIGLEALTRGFDRNGNRVAPNDLFRVAELENLLIEFDRLCRRTALASFVPFYHAYPDLMLFLNLNTSIIDQGVVGSGNLINSVRDFKINPSNIVIELVENIILNIEDLRKFSATYHEYGFLIALDDFGKGGSNLERIVDIMPDISFPLKTRTCLILLLVMVFMIL